jgi:hypothetical protein
MRPHAWRISLIVLAVFLAGAVAVSTERDTHPDEYAHLDAFRYFESHLWPPEPGSDDVIYSAYGWSRVYTGEVVYWIFGKVGALFRGDAPFVFYRLLNVCLLAAALSYLLFTRCRWCNTAAVAVTLACIPQVIYIHGYANSDAWGVSLGLFLFGYAAVLADRAPDGWRIRDSVILGCLAGGVLGAKSPYLLALILPAGILIVSACRSGSLRRHLVKLAVALLAAAAVAAPLKVVYPFMQSDYEEAIEQMRYDKARGDLKPGAPLDPGFKMASKGATAWELIAEKQWLQKSAASFYGAYGYLSIWNPLWLYLAAGAAALLLSVSTLMETMVAWSHLDGRLRTIYLLSPVICLLAVCASLWHSLHVDFQPQGRYLFGALVPLALLLTGGQKAHPGFQGWYRIGITSVFLAACAGSLMVKVVAGAGEF